MMGAQAAWCVSLRLGVGLTWVIMAIYALHPCHAYSIDQLITRAMKQQPRGLIVDEEGQTVRVDLDIVLSMEDWHKLFNMSRDDDKHGLQKRQAIMESAGSRYWPDGIIYYEVDHHQFSRKDVRVLEAAMEEWMKHTCVQFRPAPLHARNKIVFVDGDGCASHVGMSRKPQVVTLSKGCRQKGVVTHELGHVLGFNHEQTRPDRDQYVKIRWENIPKYLEYNFRKYSWHVVRDLAVSYDYLSIMHYGKDTFTGNGRTTIETLDPQYQNLIGNRRGLSFRDIKSANILYNCRPPRNICGLRDEDCPGEGFVSKDCSCWCPTPDIHTQTDMPYFVCIPLTSTSTAAVPDKSGSDEGLHRSGRTEDGCKDQNDNCQMWAQRGECSHNSAYMHISCRKACGLCPTVAQGPCGDDYSGCEFWQERGYCGIPSPFGVFITTNCRRSCGACQTEGPGPQGKKTTQCDQQCQDEHERCQEWAAREECSATSDFMLRYCRKACNACCDPLAPNSSPSIPH